MRRCDNSPGAAAMTRVGSFGGYACRQGRLLRQFLRNATRWDIALLALSGLLPVAIFAAAAWHDYRAEMKLAHERVSATARTLAKHADAVLDSLDLVLARVADQMKGRSWEELPNSPDFHNFLKELRTGLPQAESIFVVAGDGQLAATSRSFPAPSFDAREREYFHGARQTAGIYVSAPFVGQAGTRRPSH
jgi:hypothetical protein